MIQRLHQSRPAPAPPLPTPPTVLLARPRAAGVGLAWATGLVAALGITSAVCKHVLGIAHGPLDVVSLLNLAAESGLGAWYTSSLLLLAAALLALVGWMESARGTRFARHWLVLGFIFLLLSADETIQFHERAAWPFERILRLKGAFLYGWVIPAIVFLSILGLSYWKFIAHLPPQTRKRFVLAGAVYVGGALGLEMVEGVYATRWGGATGGYAALVAIEETMEMSGAALFIGALLAHVRDVCGAVTFRLQAETTMSTPATVAHHADGPLEMTRRGITAVPTDFPPPNPAAPRRAAPRGRAVA